MGGNLKIKSISAQLSYTTTENGLSLAIQKQQHNMSMKLIANTQTDHPNVKLTFRLTDIVTYNNNNCINNPLTRPECIYITRCSQTDKPTDQHCDIELLLQLKIFQSLERKNLSLDYLTPSSDPTNFPLVLSCYFGVRCDIMFMFVSPQYFANDKCLLMYSRQALNVLS